MEWIVSLVAGAVGGNIVGGLLRNLNQGALINSISGVVGGGLGMLCLSWLGTSVAPAADAAASTGLDIGALASQVAAGGVGGAVVMAIVGLVRKAMGGN